MWTIGAVVSDLLVVVALLALVNVTTIGTSPAPASEAGSVMLIMSKPGISGFESFSTIASPVIAVVPIVTVSSDFSASLTPVTLNSTTVGTVFPLASVDVMLNGGGSRRLGFVTFTAIALPPASPVEEKMSG